MHRPRESLGSSLGSSRRCEGAKRAKEEIDRSHDCTPRSRTRHLRSRLPEADLLSPSREPSREGREGVRTCEGCEGVFKEAACSRVPRGRDFGSPLGSSRRCEGAKRAKEEEEIDRSHDCAPRSRTRHVRSRLSEAQLISRSRGPSQRCGGRCTFELPGPHDLDRGGESRGSLKNFRFAPFAIFAPSRLSSGACAVTTSGHARARSSPGSSFAISPEGSSR
jgi:hypothetical protein